MTDDQVTTTSMNHLLSHVPLTDGSIPIHFEPPLDADLMTAVT